MIIAVLLLIIAWCCFYIIHLRLQRIESDHEIAILTRFNDQLISQSKSCARCHTTTTDTDASQGELLLG